MLSKVLGARPDIRAAVEDLLVCTRKRIAAVAACLSFLICLFLAPSCSDDDNGTGPVDTVPPSQVTNLDHQTPGINSVTLTWSAPGDDGSTGQASTYDLRYMTGDESAFSWETASQVTGEPSCHTPGTAEACTVTGLTSGETYTFGLKTADERPNWSSLSNLETVQIGGGTSDCQVLPTTLAFGSVTVGSTRDLSFTITNNGTTALSGSVSEACAPFSLVAGGGSYTLSAGQSREVTVRFAPTAAGSQACTIETGVTACVDVSCTGTGTEAPAVDMVQVPAGTFTMGSDAAEGDPREEPEHTPSISTFYIDTYEVTNARYAEALNWAKGQGLITVTEGGDPNGIVLNAVGVQEELPPDGRVFGGEPVPGHLERIQLRGGERFRGASGGRRHLVRGGRLLQLAERDGRQAALLQHDDVGLLLHRQRIPPADGSGVGEGGARILR